MERPPRRAKSDELAVMCVGSLPHIEWRRACDVGSGMLVTGTTSVTTTVEHHERNQVPNPSPKIQVATMRWSRRWYFGLAFWTWDLGLGTWDLGLDCA